MLKLIRRGLWFDAYTQIEHNKVICIEDKTAKSTISFTGPPKK